jgi:hypothetical protein
MEVPAQADTSANLATPMASDMIARLILSADQTADLIAQVEGETVHGRAWGVVAPGSWPDSPGKLVLHLIECPTIAAANGAVRVAMGEAVAAKPRRAKA